MTFDVTQFLGDLRLIYPEFILTSALLLIIVLELIFKSGARRTLIAISLLAFLSGLYFINEEITGEHLLLFGAISYDGLIAFFKILFCLVGIFSVLIYISSTEIHPGHTAEFLILILGATLGMFFLASASDVVTFYLSFEAVSLPSYALAGLALDPSRSREAALKYLIFGAVSSGIMLFGLTMLVGALGSTSFIVMKQALVKSYITPGSLIVILSLIIAGFAFKISAVPFHMWAPDVYEGAATPVTAFFSVGPKIAGFAVIFRFFFTVFTPEGGTGGIFIGSSEWYMLWGALSVLTMTLGNLAAINQKNVKRLLAYSSIAHAGYMLIGVLLTTKEGIASVLLYLLIYLFMNLGAFYIVILFRERLGSENIDDYRGIGWRAPYLSVAFSVFLLSLTGIPPLAGFIAKVVLFASAIHESFYLIVIIAVLNSVLSLYYYAGIIKKMFLERSDNLEVIKYDLYDKLLVLIFLAPVIIGGVYWNPLYEWVFSVVRL